MPYLNRLKDFEVGKIYIPHKDIRRRDSAHWHNNYYIPVKHYGRSKMKVITINSEKGANITDTAKWSDFVRKSIFKDVTDWRLAIIKVFDGIFKDIRR